MITTFNLLKLFLPYVGDKEDIVMEVVAEEEELLEGVLGKGIDSPNYYYMVSHGKVVKVNWLWI